MRILGVDPGLAHCGWGIIAPKSGSGASKQALRLVDFGTISTSSKDPLSERLQRIYSEFLSLYQIYRPEAVAVETVYMKKNMTSALPVAHARGVILLSAGLRDLPVHEYSPSSLKQSVVGYGRASKQQVQQMVSLLLGLKEVPQPDHAADALAAAIALHHTFTGDPAQVPV